MSASEGAGRYANATLRQKLMFGSKHMSSAESMCRHEGRLIFFVLLRLPVRGPYDAKREIIG